MVDTKIKKFDDVLSYIRVRILYPLKYLLQFFRSLRESENCMGNMIRKQDKNQ